MVETVDSSAVATLRRSQAGVAQVIFATALSLTALSLGLRRYGRQLTELVKTNQILQAVFASSALGTVSFTLLKLWQLVAGWLRAHTFSSVTLTNKDESFEKIIDFIGKQGLTATGALVASTRKKKRTWKDWKEEFMLGQRRPPEMEYLPANNNDIHVIYYRGTRILMQRSKGQTVIAGWERKPMQMETLSLSSWGRNDSAIRALINEALKASFVDESSNLNVYTLSSGWPGGWEKALSKRPRPIESVILDEDLANNLIEDAKKFLESCEWYASVGIPYRRGYLLYGPPGCGKTSFCQALAGALNLDLCILTLSNKDLGDNQLAEHMRDAPSNAIVLLEDVDAVFVDRTAQREHATGVTFSGLLNALDGVASQEGRLFFMTTNHIEKLDPALIRPGRCDVRVELRKASRQQAALLFKRFFPGGEEFAEEFSSALPECELSMAQLQGYLLEHQGNPISAARNAHKLLLASKPKDVDRMSIYEHLRRVGLEQWAATFEQRGYSFKVDCDGMDLAQVKSWSPMLRIDAAACSRMGRLLKGDASLLRDYQLVDMATAKDMFVATYRLYAEGEGAGAKMLARRASSEVFSASKAELAEATELNQLANQMCLALQRNGTSVVSIWQLRRHLRIYADDMKSAVATAGALGALPPKQQAPVDDMSTFQWLQRCCLEHHASKLEDKGYHESATLNGLQEGGALKDLGIDDERELRVLKALIGADSAKTDILLSFIAPDRPGARAMFLDHFALAAKTPEFEADIEQLAGVFAAHICDELGNGLVSRAQVSRYLRSFPADAMELDNAKSATEHLQKLLAPKRAPDPPRPEPAPPTEEIHTWLTEHGLEEYATGFIQQKLCSSAQLGTCEPPLSIQDLRAAGVDKLGHQRKLLALIRALKPPPQEAEADSAASKK